jgi:hypothetical protein
MLRMSRSAQVETKRLGKTRSLDFDKRNPGVSIRSSLVSKGSE